MKPAQKLFLADVVRREDGDLDGAVAVEERSQGARQVRERGALLNKSVGGNRAVGNQLQSSTDGLRRVVERAFEVQFIIVNTVGVEANEQGGNPSWRCVAMRRGEPSASYG